MKLKNKAVLVTGGAGFIGSHLVDALIQEGPEKIVVVDNFFLGQTDNLKGAMANFDKLTIHREDAAGYIAMENIITNEGIDVVFDLAVKPLPYSFTNPEGAFMTSVNVASTLLNLQLKGHFDTLVHFSSSEAYGTATYTPMDEKHPLEPTTPYSGGKASADLLAMTYFRTFGLDVRILRPFNNYGPRQNKTLYAAVIPITINRILEGNPPIIEWDGKQTRDFLYVQDTAKAAIKMFESAQTKGAIVNIASGKETSIETIIHSIMKNMGYAGKTLTRPKRAADLRRHWADISLARKLIGFQPEVELDEGIRRTVEWYLANRAASR